MRTLGIIPARYASSRLPGKPLAMIGQRPMIEHVYRRAAQAFDQLLVATDDQRILSAVEAFGGHALLTDPAHQSGTDRCLEAYQTWRKQGGQAEVIVNVQGDEPLLHPPDLKALVALFVSEETELGTLVKKIGHPAQLQERSGCFVVLNNQQEALYFSRRPLPVQRDVDPAHWLNHHPYYQHLGLYAFRPESLARFASLPPSPLEQAEKLEQLRWLEHGGRIRVAFAEGGGPSVDTPEDLEKVRALWAGKEGEHAN